jgi:hypothetical protein
MFEKRDAIKRKHRPEQRQTSVSAGTARACPSSSPAGPPCPRREDIHRLEEVHGPLQLGVPAVLDHVTQRGLPVGVKDLQGILLGGLAPRDAPDLDRGLLVLGEGHAEVGGDPLLMDHLVAGRVVLGCGEPESRAVGQRKDALDGALSEALLAHDDGPLEVLKASGDDLRCAGAASIDQHHHGNGPRLPPCSRLAMHLIA